MAGSGTAKNGRESQSKRLGVKKYSGELVKAGSVIVRQRGTKFHNDINTGIGKDHTIFATKDGYVEFFDRKGHKTVRILEKQ